MIQKRKILHPRNIKNLIIITGQQRSGKTTLSKMISSLEGPVNTRVDFFLESLFQLKRINKITNIALQEILKIYLNRLIIESNYGRNFNLKKGEDSSIWNSINPNYYLDVIKKKFTKIEIKKSLIKNNEIVFVLHNFIEFLNNFPKKEYKIKIINVQSHPVDQIYSMYKAKTNFKFDNLSSEMIYIYKNRKFCLSIGLEDKFNKLNLMQKILLIKRNQDIKELKNIKSSEKYYKYLNIVYEDLINNSEKSVKIISKFLNKKQTHLTKNLIKVNKKKKFFLNSIERKKRLTFINLKLKDDLHRKIFKNMIINFNKENV